MRIASNRTGKSGLGFGDVLGFAGVLGVGRQRVRLARADVNKTVDAGRTLLMAAAQGGHPGVVRCLGKELGADVNKRCNLSSRP